MNNYGISDFVFPVKGKARITSTEGNRTSRRTTNGNKMSSYHRGIDIASDTPGKKVPIHNASAGEVVFAGNINGYGKTVIVRNHEGYLLQYAHLDSIGVKVGDKVGADQQIGIMGSTGNSTGVHLDFTVFKDNMAITRAGTPHVAAPKYIAQYSKGGSAPKGTTVSETVQQANPMYQVQQQQVQTPQTQQPQTTQTAIPTAEGIVGDVLDKAGVSQFVGNPMKQTGPTINVLQGALGPILPDDGTQNTLFGQVASMGLSASEEPAYAEMAQAIAGVKSSIAGKPMIQSENPIRTELSSLFDSLEV